MKIAGIDRVRLHPRMVKEGYGDAGSMWPATLPSVLVRVRADDGTEGFGEATSQTWYLGETVGQIESVLALYADALVGQPADNIALAHRTMAAVYAAVPGGRAPRAAVDMALHDLAAKARGVPVSTLLGGALRTRLDQLTNLYHATPEAMADGARDFVARGFRGLKIKVGESLLTHGWSRTSLEHELAKLRAALDAVPATVMIDADANQAWGSAQATVAALRQLSHHPNLAIEQPLPAEDLEGAAFVRAHAGLPMVLDEPVCSPRAAMALVRRGACDRVVIKLNRVGGLFPAMQVATLCEAAGVGVSVDTNPFTRLGDTASAHLAATLPTHYPVDCEGHVSFLSVPEEVMQGGVSFAGGQAIVPAGPGLGVTVDWDAATRHDAASRR